MSILKKLVFFLAPLALFTMLPGLLSAQDDPAENDVGNWLR